MIRKTLIIFVFLAILSHVGSMAQATAKPIADTSLGYWNRPKTPTHLYREIELWYEGDAEPGVAPTILPLTRLKPSGNSLSDLMTAEECRQKTIDSLRFYYDANEEGFHEAVRLWTDREEGIVGLETREGPYHFARFVCLPMGLVDDLDRVGTQYRTTYVKGSGIYRQDKVDKGYALALEPGDSRALIRYDLERFFKRFGKYGIKPTLEVPNTQYLEAWNDSAWNKVFRVMPLGEAITLDSSKAESNAIDPKLAQKIYEQAGQYMPKRDEEAEKRNKEEMQKALEWLNKPRSEWK